MQLYLPTLIIKLIVVNRVIEIHVLFVDYLCSSELIKSILLFRICMIRKVVLFSRFADDGQTVRNIFAITLILFFLPISEKNLQN